MFCFINFAFIFGGGCGIRTHVGFEPQTVFKTASL